LLYGTEEELRYHSARAADELSLSNGCDDDIASKLHLEIANLHRSRSELVIALRNARSNRRSNYIYRADKES
jgi:hypothetical protein